MTWAYLKLSKPSSESLLLASAITTGPFYRWCHAVQHAADAIHVGRRELDGRRDVVDLDQGRTSSGRHDGPDLPIHRHQRVENVLAPHVALDQPDGDRLVYGKIEGAGTGAGYCCWAFKRNPCCDATAPMVPASWKNLLREKLFTPDSFIKNRWF